MNPLCAIDDYSQYIANLLDRKTILESTLVVWSTSRYTGIAEGEVFFINSIRLRLREELDFSDCLITAYGYEVYQENVKLYWYDDFPHPHDPTLAVTFPHHKHVHPDIKQNRIPAHDLSFSSPNLGFLVSEIEGALS